MWFVLYHFELQMAGVILLGAMLVCGVWLYVIRRRRDRLLDAQDGLLGRESEPPDNDNGSAEGNDGAGDIGSGVKPRE